MSSGPDDDRRQSADPNSSDSSNGFSAGTGYLAKYYARWGRPPADDEPAAARAPEPYEETTPVVADEPQGPLQATEWLTGHAPSTDPAAAAGYSTEAFGAAPAEVEAAPAEVDEVPFLTGLPVRGVEPTRPSTLGPRFHTAEERFVTRPHEGADLLPPPQFTESQTAPTGIRGVDVAVQQPAGGAAAVRPYMWTRGRTRSGLDLAIESLVSTSDQGRDQIGLLQVEHRAVAELCEQVHSVAEVAALMSLPLGVARVLLGDMAGLGVITVHQTASSSGGLPDLALMERVLSGLRRL